MHAWVRVQIHELIGCSDWWCVCVCVRARARMRSFMWADMWGIMALGLMVVLPIFPIFFFLYVCRCKSMKRGKHSTQNWTDGTCKNETRKNWKQTRKNTRLRSGVTWAVYLRCCCTTSHVCTQHQHTHAYIRVHTEICTSIHACVHACIHAYIHT